MITAGLTATPGWSQSSDGTLPEPVPPMEASGLLPGSGSLEKGSDEPPPSADSHLENQPPEIAPLEDPLTPMEGQTSALDSELAEPPSVSDEELLQRTPLYQLSRPSWGMQVSGSLSALGGVSLDAADVTARNQAVQLSIEYQFPFLQSVGVFSLGPTAGFYPLKRKTPGASGGLLSSFQVESSPEASSFVSIWGAGGVLQYQARFFREQILVPFGGIEYQMLRINTTAVIESVHLFGPIFGGMLLLNQFEPTAVTQGFATSGLSRSYLVFAGKSLSGTTALGQISGISLFFGLRLEI